MAMPRTHLSDLIDGIPSAWWVYLKLRLHGCLSPGASRAAVHRVIREALDEADRPRREQRAHLRAQGRTAKEIDALPILGASWNSLAARMLQRESLLSAKGDAMADQYSSA